MSNNVNTDKVGITHEEFAEKYNLNANADSDISDASFEKSHALRMERILALSDCLLEKIGRAIDELALCEAKEKKRIKTVEYDKELNKPVSETNIESETSEIKNTLIDTSALKQLVSTLKDIKDIHLSYSDSSSSESDENGVILISDVENGGEVKQ